MTVCHTCAHTSTNILTHRSLGRIGSRRGFGFALIGCIIWDTRSRAKPSEEEEVEEEEEEEEEAWEACA